MRLLLSNPHMLATRSSSASSSSSKIVPVGAQTLDMPLQDYQLTFEQAWREFPFEKVYLDRVFEGMQSNYTSLSFIRREPNAPPRVIVEDFDATEIQKGKACLYEATNAIQRTKSILTWDKEFKDMPFLFVKQIKKRTAEINALGSEMLLQHKPMVWLLLKPDPSFLERYSNVGMWYNIDPNTLVDYRVEITPCHNVQGRRDFFHAMHMTHSAVANYLAKVVEHMKDCLNEMDAPTPWPMLLEERIKDFKVMGQKLKVYGQVDHLDNVFSDMVTQLQEYKKYVTIKYSIVPGKDFDFKIEIKFDPDDSRKSWKEHVVKATAECLQEQLIALDCMLLHVAL